MRSIKDNAGDATFTPTVASGIESMTIEEAVNEVGVDVEALKVADTTLSTELSTVKVKSTENDLAIQSIRRDQTLANQSEAKITTSDYSIVALPKNATGNLKMKREGLTATNLVENGDFANGTSGFINENFNITPLSYGYRFVTTLIGADNKFSQNISIITGHVYAYIIHFKNVSGTTSSLVFSDSNTFLPLIGVPINTGINLITTLVTAIGSGTTDVRLFRTSNAAIGDEFEVYSIMLINLTQTFGAGNEPDLATSKKIFPTYFADTKNVPFTGRYRGRGKNLFDKSNVTLGVHMERGSTEVYTSRFVTDYIKIKPSTQYIPSNNVSASAHYRNSYFDKNKVFIAKFNEVGLTSPANAYYVRLTGEIVNIEIMQYELGNTATPYEPFEAHDLYLTAPEGRSVPSAKDSVEVQDGKLVHVKRVSDDYEIPSITIASGTYVTRGYYGPISDANILLDTSKEVGVLGWNRLAGQTWDVAGNEGSFYVGLNKYIYFIMALGTTAPQFMAQLALLDTKVIYQLATPITTPIDSDGSLPAGASVLWEPAIPDVGIYTTKFDILDTDHPIASIDKLYKVDFTTGVQTLLTDAVVAGDGLSFTSASLADGDLVNVIYFYATANPEGLTTVTYLNSNLVSIDTVTGKAYTHKMKITNGVIQPLADWTLTEVV